MTTTKVLPKAETDLLVYLLSLNGQPKVVKSALQRLCELLEAKFNVGERSTFRSTALGLIWHTDIQVRRWAFKALTLLGRSTSTDLVGALYSRLAAEIDFENRAWAISSIGSFETHASVKAICDRAGIEYLKEYELAVRLFAVDRTNPISTAFVNIERDTAEVLLWTSLLEGYEKAPQNIAHHKHENHVLITQLNSHPDAKVAEYSIWSLWHHPLRSPNDLAVPRHAYSNQAPPIRRWIYRLQTKRPEALVADSDFFKTMVRDSSDDAREGLALGLRTARVTCGTEDFLEWHAMEETPQIKDLILEHMARNSDGRPAFSSLVSTAYQDNPRDSSFRNRMKSASSGTELLNDLRRIDVEEERQSMQDSFVRQGQSGFLLPEKGSLVVNINGNVGNLSLGNQSIHAEKLVQDFSSNGLDANSIAQILKLATEVLNPVDQAALAKEINAFAEERSPQTAKSLKDRLIGLSETVTAGGKFAGAVDKLIEAVSGFGV